jgi:hypothetical protein
MRFLSFALGAALSLSFFAHAYDSDAYNYENKKYAVHYEQKGTYQKVSFEGEITPLVSREGLNEIKKHLVKGEPILLVIGVSYGGYEAAFHHFERSLKETCTSDQGEKLCSITTYLTGTCGSSCIELFMSGDYRVVESPYISFGFHRKWMLNERFAIVSKQKMAEKYIRLGADPEWFQSHSYIFNDQRGVWVPAPDLISAKIVNLIDEDFIPKYEKLL